MKFGKDHNGIDGRMNGPDSVKEWEDLRRKGEERQRCQSQTFLICYCLSQCFYQKTTFGLPANAFPPSVIAFDQNYPLNPQFWLLQKSKVTKLISSKIQIIKFGLRNYHKKFNKVERWKDAIGKLAKFRTLL